MLYWIETQAVVFSRDAHETRKEPRHNGSLFGYAAATLETKGLG